VIVVEGVRKSFGTTVALQGVDLVVERGTVLGLLGRNGAGKSTLVRILSTLLVPDAGSARIGGVDVLRDPQRVRSLIGLAGQSAAVDEALTGRENLELVGRLYGLGAREARARAQEVLERLSLTGAADRRVLTYSGGMRRRVDLGASLVGRPLVLIMDEPTTGLDPLTRSELWKLIEGLVQQGTTVLLTTQYLEEADRLADQIAVIDQGRVIAAGTPSELKDRLGREVLEVRARDSVDVGRVRGMLVGLGSGEPVADMRRRKVTLTTRDPMSTLITAGSRIKASGIAVDDLGLRRPDLDDVFLTLTAGSASGQAVNGAGAASPPTPPGAEQAPPGTQQPPGRAARRRRGRRRLLSYLAVAGISAGVAVTLISVSRRSPPRVRVAAASPAQSLQSIAGISQGRTVALGATPGGATPDTRGNIWVSLPDRGAVARVNAATGYTQTFPVGGHPGAILAGFDRIWVAGSAISPLASLNLFTGAPLAVTDFPTVPTAMAADDDDTSACIVDASGGISHIDSTGTLIGAGKVFPAATAAGCGEGWVWGVHTAPGSLVRMGDFGGTTPFNVGPAPVGVAFDTGVWTALANGQVTVFDPRLDRLQVNRQITVAPGLAGIVARENDPSVWAISKQTRTLYRISNTPQPTLTGTVVFNSPPVALTLADRSVWVALQDGSLTQIRF
jgi:daunorubicin resistance ABC transporter ATP-binding subunit